MPIFSPKLVTTSDASGEPIINTGNGVLVDSLTSVLATGANVNLNTINALKYTQVNSGYSGAGSEASMVSYLSTLAETRVGGGTYGQIYNPG